MSDDPIIRQIHDSGLKLVYEFTGAGSVALAKLHAVGGSSRTILQATDRYAPASLSQLLGGTPATFVSQSTAMAMAERAFARARALSRDDDRAVGLAATATIATDRAKRGAHACWIAARGWAGSTTYGATLRKGARDRAAEEEIVTQMALLALADAAGLSDAPAPALIEGEALVRDWHPTTDPIARLIGGAVAAVGVAPDGQLTENPSVGGVICSGSFNPLHAGHENLARAAARFLDAVLTFELPVINADKPPLTHRELRGRLGPFQWRHALVLTRAPLFADKAALFPGATFVIGADTALRLLEARFYGGDAARDESLRFIRAQRCRFLVAGRVGGDARFLTLQHLPIPDEFVDLFAQLPDFRHDISSTALRARLTRREE